MRFEELEGVGAARAKKLREAGLSSLEDLAELEPEQLEQLGFSSSLARQVVVEARNNLTVEEQVSTYKILLVVALVGVAIFASYSLLSNAELFTDSYEYNGFVFTESDACGAERDCWVTNVQLNVGARQVPFYYGPREAEDVLVEPEAVDRVLSLTYPDVNGTVVILFDEGASGSYGVAASNLARVTGERVYNLPTMGDVYGESFSCDYPRGDDVLIRVTNGPSGVRLEGSCVVVSGSEEEILRVMDAYRLSLLRILQ